MYWLHYLRYFLFLAWNWNLRLALFITRHEITGEKKYGIRTTGVDYLPSHLSEDELEHVSIYQPVNFYTAENLFGQLTFSDKQLGLLDVGCGKGRVLAMAAAQGFRHIYGFDFSPDLCADAALLSSQLQTKHTDLVIDLECAHAENYFVPDDTGVIFLFNPFDHVIMKHFVHHVMESLTRNPRVMKVLYANPVCKELWLDAGFKEVFHFKKLKYLEGSIFEFQPK